jgi:hypothetical protein
VVEAAGVGFRGSRVTPVEGRDLSSRQTQQVVGDGRLGNLETPLKSGDRGWCPTRKRRRHRGKTRWISVTTRESSDIGSCVAPWTSDLRNAPCAKGVRFVREPDAGNLHVRFDERDVETE